MTKQLVFPQKEASNAALKESLNNRRVELDHVQANILAELSAIKQTRSDFDSTLRMASRYMHRPRIADKARTSPAATVLAVAVRGRIGALISAMATTCGPPPSAPTGRASSRRQMTRPPTSGTPISRRWRRKTSRAGLRAPRRRAGCRVTRCNRAEMVLRLYQAAPSRRLCIRSPR